MLEMLKERKAALEAQGKKGFTLMEMLIVIAIIAILIAIAIPLFTSQLNNAKHAADEANARSIYAVAMADYMDNNAYDSTYSYADRKLTITTGTGTGTAATTQTFDFSDICTGVTVTTTAGAPPKVSMSDTGFDDVEFPS